MVRVPNLGSFMKPSPPRPIATLNEGPLHAALKAWVSRPGDRNEVPLAGRQIDIVRGDLLIEIQTSSVSSLRMKLEALVDEHPVRLIHPVALEKWIVRIDEEQRLIGRRKSPKRGRLEDAFEEIVSVSWLLAHPSFSLEILLTQEEEVRTQAPGRGWRRKGWVVVERRLVGVVESHVISHPADLLGWLPPGLPSPFTTAHLAEGLSVSRDLAQKMAYCLRESGAIQRVGKQGNALTYRLAESAGPIEP